MMLSPSVTAKPPDKKLQGALKSVVKAFGDLLFTWRDLHSSLNNHLSLISNLLHTEHSIHSTLNVRSKYYHSMTSSNFHDLRDRLHIILLKEMERTLTTVRDSIRDLDSVGIAMRMKADEAFQLVSDQPLDSFGDGAVFDTSHVLEVMDMSVLFEDEIVRLKYVVEEILTEKGSASTGEHSRISAKIETALIPNKALEQRVERFLLQNSLSE